MAHDALLKCEILKSWNSHRIYTRLKKILLLISHVYS